MPRRDLVDILWSEVCDGVRNHILFTCKKGGWRSCGASHPGQVLGHARPISSSLIFESYQAVRVGLVHIKRAVVAHRTAQLGVGVAAGPRPRRNRSDKRSLSVTVRAPVSS